MASLFRYFAYLGYRALESLLALVPLPVCWLLGDCAGRLAWLGMPGSRRRARRNLLRACGDEWSRRDCRRIVRRHFAALGRNGLCGVKLARMKPAAVDRRLSYENRAAALAALEEGRGVVAAWSGMGPRQLFFQAAVFGAGVESAVLCREHPNRFLERHLARIRQRNGVQSFPLRLERSSPMEHLRKGGGLGIVLDVGDESGIWCPLFGRLTPVSNLPGLLSARTGARVVSLGVYPAGIARWRIVFGPPVAVPPHPAVGAGQPAKATAQVVASAEQLIRRAPAEWRWLATPRKTRSPEFLLSRRGLPVEYAPGMEDAPLKPFRILVRSPNWLGDACMAAPALRALKRGRPDARIAVLCNDNLKQLWEHVPEVDRVIPKRRQDGLFRVASAIAREGPWDAGVLFPNSPRSALEMRLARVPLVIGYGGRGRSLLLHRRIREAKRPGPPEHHARRYLRIAEALGAESSDPALFAIGDPQPPFQGKWRIGICPGAAYGNAKRWPVERYARVVEKLHERLAGRADWVIYGAPGELPIAASLQEQCRVALENLAGRTTLAQLIADLKTCHTLITNDTGTMHLAAMLGVKTVAIFGSTEPAITAPLGPGHEVLRVHVDCSPCFLRECPRDFRCMNAIGEDAVVAAAARILERRGAAAPETA